MELIVRQTFHFFTNFFDPIRIMSIKVKEIFGSNTKIIADIEEDRHCREIISVFNVVNISATLS